MAKVTMGNPLPSKGEVVGSGKDLTGTFKSLKRSLKDTLERLETIGLTDLNSGDEVSDLKIQLAQKEKTIEELTGEIKRLSILLSSRSIEP